MESQFVPADAPSDLLALRAYTSRLLGAEPSLVLHGGGNTSVKGRTTDFFGDDVDVLYVKGSGWDLRSIEPAGFSPVRLSVLLRLASRAELTDVEMVREQRIALLDPAAPNPSIEAILHAVIPHRFVDHTHADAVITLSNSPDGESRIRALYGDRVLVVPYVMPGFELARRVYEMTRGVDWQSLEGMILLNHGVFSFHDDAQESYERTIRLVTAAEESLREAGAFAEIRQTESSAFVDPLRLAELRALISRAAGRAMCARVDASPLAAGFAAHPKVDSIATRGPITPDHTIRTKCIPMVVEDDFDGAVEAYAKQYRAYFERHGRPEHTMLDPAPRWAVWRGRGIVGFGASAKAAGQVTDIANSTIKCIQWAEALGGWTPLVEPELFRMEYWELEQRKLRSGSEPPLLSGKVAIVSGAAGGIGWRIAELFMKRGAAVVGLDVNPAVTDRFQGPNNIGVVCDVTDSDALDLAVEKAVLAFGGLDIVVSNAGNFPPSQAIADIEDEAWARTLDLNLSGHMRLLRAAAPFLEYGVDPSVVVVASRNVPAPGPGAAAYSVSKAALTQLARVAALELAPFGVRVNMVHPDKVFDTELWSEEKIALRAQHYGVSVDDYRRRNLLKTEVTTHEVAGIALALVGPSFRCTTGAQIPVDGGDARVI